MRSTCCFTGHREISERECVRIKKKLKKILLELIRKELFFMAQVEQEDLIR